MDQRLRSTSGLWALRNRPAYLMVSLFLLLLVNPAFEGKPFARLTLSLLFTLIMFAAVLAVATQRRLLVAVFCLGVPWLVVNWVGNFVTFGTAWNLIEVILLAAFSFLVLSLLVRDLLTTPTVTSDTLCRAVSAYLMIGLGWAAVYAMLVLLNPDAIDFPGPRSGWNEYIYFSFTTLTTLGYGDIRPLSPFARSFAIVEGVIGPIYLAVLIARLVAMYKKTPPEPLK